jgi:hypothetical protein
MSNHATNDESISPSLKVHFNSAEVIALKELAVKRRKGFWRDYSLLISLCAFLLSLITAIISAYLGYRRDVHDQLNELSTAIRSIQELNLKQLEVNEKYSGSNAANPAIALISNQIYNATITAADIAFRAGTSGTTASIIPISQNLYNYGQYARAEALAKIGLSASITFEDETTALRWLGTMKIEAGTAESVAEGNELFVRALNFEQRYGPVRDPRITSLIKATLLLNWADLLAKRDCEQARKRFSDGIQFLNSAGVNPDSENVRGTARKRFTSGIGDIVSCKPSPDVGPPNSPVTP